MNDYGLSWNEPTRWRSGYVKLDYYERLFDSDDVFETMRTAPNDLYPGLYDISLGLARHYSGDDPILLSRIWNAFFGELEMLFFFLVGKYDIQAKSVEGRVSYETMWSQWETRFGTTYYYCVYKGVLFLGLFSNDRKERHLSEKQVACTRVVLKEHMDVRWMLVFVHHPLWESPHVSNFDNNETLLEGRKYSVFAVQQKMYRHFERKNTNYYFLATTGSGSPLLGTEFGEFNHVTWVTMADDGPKLANLRLDGNKGSIGRGRLG